MLNIREIVRNVIEEYFNVDEPVIEEGKKRKVVVRKGKRVKKLVADKGQKIVGGKAIRMGAAERVKRQRGARKATRKKAPKQKRITKKRNKSLRRRRQYGLDR